MRIKDPIRLLKPAVFITALVPLALLIVRGFGDRLGANPVETIEQQTGLWALYFLLITLSVTPLRRLAGWNGLARLRRMLGLYCFFYACLHFSSWLLFDHFFDWAEIVKDIGKRPYVTVGFTAFVLLIPLAVTSTHGMVKRLGGARWRKLHSAVYIIGTLAILHFLWLVKADTREPIFYGIILITLLSLRLPAMIRRTQPLAVPRRIPQTVAAEMAATPQERPRIHRPVTTTHSRAKPAPADGFWQSRKNRSPAGRLKAPEAVSCEQATGWDEHRRIPPP